MDDLDNILEEALELGDEGRFEEMAEALELVLAKTDEDPFVLGWLGVAHRELGNDGIAYEYFKRCVAAEPDDPRLLALAGTGLAAFDDPEAESVLRMAALSGPNMPETRLHYGAYLAREGLFPEALENLRAAASLAPDDPIMHAELGIAYALKGDTANAATSMEQTLEIAPDDSWTRVLLGLILIDTDRFEEGAEALLEAARERTDDGEAQLLAALAGAAAGWTDAAHEAFARAEFAAETADSELMQETDERLDDEVAARQFLIETAAPSALHDRLSQPL